MLGNVPQSESAQSFLRSPRRKMRRSQATGHYLRPGAPSLPETISHASRDLQSRFTKTCSRPHFTRSRGPHQAFEMQGQPNSISTWSFESPRSPLYEFTPKSGQRTTEESSIERKATIRIEESFVYLRRSHSDFEVLAVQHVRLFTLRSESTSNRPIARNSRAA